jgi:hypothetical protein
MLARKGRGFDDIITIQKLSQATLSEFKTQDFSKCFQQWRERWTVIKWQGNSME